MNDAYKINWSADITPALAMLGNSMRARRALDLQEETADRADERSRAYLDMERDAVAQRAARESAAVMREQERDKYNRAVQGFNALPGLKRMARKDVAAANANPYGYQFDAQDVPQDNEVPAAAEAARYMLNPTAAEEAAPRTTPESTPRPAGALDYGVEGPSETPEGEAYRFAKPGSKEGDAQLEDLMGSAQEGVQPLDFMTQAAMAASGQSPEQKRLFMTYNGQRSEVPTQDEVSGFGEKYDAMYNALIDDGEDPHKARMFIAAQAKQEMADKARDNRLADTLGFRGRNREDIQDFTREENAKYKETHAGRMELGEQAGKYKVRAAGASQVNPLKIDTGNRQDMSALRSSFSEWKKTVNLSIDSKSHKRLATAMANLNSGNAMQQREAAESLVSIFKGGGQVTKASQDLLLKHLAGIVGDVQTWLQHAESGHFGARELKVLQDATKSALAEEQERLHAYYDSAVDTYGPGSGWEMLGGNVNHMIKGAFRQFGYEAPDIYESPSEPVVLGSGKRPTTKSAKTGKPQTVTIRNEKTGETKEVTLEEAKKMGAQ